jgi:dolichyl-phosphate-mannose-protein mannosyltransferase
MAAPDKLERLRARLGGDAGLIALCLAMIAFGIGLRAWDLGFPRHFTFDEHHFVENARAYLAGQVDRNDHPPLGKLILALGIRWFGDNPLGWRIFPFGFGLVNVALVAALAARLFAGWRPALIAAALVAADGFFIAYSRAALLDGMLTCFVLASALATIEARSWRGVLVASVLVGLAVSIKFSGITPAAAIAVFTLVLRRAPQRSVLALGAVLVVYGLVFSLGLAISGREAGPRAVWEATGALTQHHLALTDMTNPATSHWYTWFLPVRPILLSLEPVPGGARVMSMLGNPLLWWSVSLGVLLGLVSFVERIGKRGPPAAGFFTEHRAAIGTLILFWLLPIVPWIVSRRDSYIYHYLPAYGFGVILVAGWLAHVYAKRLLYGLLVLLLLAEVSVFYAPVWAKVPITHEAVAQRLFVKSWR